MNVPFNKNITHSKILNNLKYEKFHVSTWKHMKTQHNHMKTFKNNHIAILLKITKILQYLFKSIAPKYITLFINLIESPMIGFENFPNDFYFFLFFKKILPNFLDPTVIFLYSSSLSLSLFFFFPSLLYSFLTLLLYLSHVFYIVTFVNVHGVDRTPHHQFTNLDRFSTVLGAQKKRIQPNNTFFFWLHIQKSYIYIFLSPDKHHKVSSYFLETSYK